jgi:hypothetical protein
MASLAACAGYTFFTRYIFQPDLDLLGRAEQPRTGGEKRGDSRPPIRPDRYWNKVRTRFGISMYFQYIGQCLANENKACTLMPPWRRLGFSMPL